MTPKEAVKTACWVAVEGDSDLLHLFRIYCSYLILVGFDLYSTDIAQQKAEWCIPVIVFELMQ